MGGLIGTIILGGCVKPVDFWLLGKDNGISIIISGLKIEDNAPELEWWVGGSKKVSEPMGPVSNGEQKIAVAFISDITVKVTNVTDYAVIEWFGGADKTPLVSDELSDPVGTFTVGEDNAGHILTKVSLSGSYAITVVGEAKADGNKYSTLFHIVLN